MRILRSIENFYKYKRKILQLRPYGIQTTTTDLKVLFFGTDNFSLPSLKLLHKHTGNVGDLGVVTSFKNPPNCIRLYANKYGLSLYKWPVNAEECLKYDLGVVVSFGHLIPSDVINAFPLGMINVHASLLPRWRGAAPIIYALMSGDRKTGVTIMRIEPKYFDTGNIIDQRTVDIKHDMLLPELHDQLSTTGANLLIDVIKGYPKSFENSRKQNELEVTYAPKISSEFSTIRWSQMTAEEIYARYRSLYGFKNLVTSFYGKVIQLLDIKVCKDYSPTTINETNEQEIHEGDIMYHKQRKCLIVTCLNETYIEVHRLKVENKKAMTALEFRNGYLKVQQQCNGIFESSNITFY